MGCPYLMSGESPFSFFVTNKTGGHFKEGAYEDPMPLLCLFFAFSFLLPWARLIQLSEQSSQPLGWARASPGIRSGVSWSPDATAVKMVWDLLQKQGS